MDTTQKLKDKYLTRKESASNSSYSVFDKMIIRTASIIKVHSELNKSLRDEKISNSMKILFVKYF